MNNKTEIIKKEIIGLLRDTRKRELELMDGLSRDELIGPPMRIVEPPIWELGHVGWFQDRWILQNIDKCPPVSGKADSLYNSFNIPNSERFDLYFPPLEETLGYISEVLELIIDRVKNRELTDEDIYFYRLALNHEDMHTETMHHIRHTLDYPPPKLSMEPFTEDELSIEKGFDIHDAQIPGGIYNLGATHDIPFVFDNEKWAHPIEIEPYQISALPVTVKEYMEFVEAGGYLDASLWGEIGWNWVQENEVKHPAFWKKDSGGVWIKKYFNQDKKLSPYDPMIHVNWFEANAYCKWTDRRLPTEAEWELAASGELSSDGKSFTSVKRSYPWGNERPNSSLANINSRNLDVVDVRAFPQGDSAFGLRQMIGNVWEWTSSTFDAYPGFTIDPYDTYSEPSFGQQKVLRGGCWATRPHVLRNTFRNFYTPDRNNIFAGFRTVKDS